MKEVIYSELLPKAIGPYSPGIKVNNVFYFSGQIPLVAETMELISEDFVSQANQVFKNLQLLCEAAHGKLSDLVKITIYLTDLKQFPLVNEVMQTFFQSPYPARTTIEVSALPKSAQIEVDAIMVLN